MTGRVIRLYDSGVGWIAPDDGSKPYFFHLMVVNRNSQPINVGDPVAFNRKTGYKANFAVNIWKMEPPGLWQIVRDQTYERLIPDLDEEEPKWPLYSTAPEWDEIHERRRTE